MPVYTAEIEVTHSSSVAPFAKVADEIQHLLQTNIYDPNILLSPAYKDIQAKINALSIQAMSEPEFIDGFNQLWKNGPFSHINLVKSPQTPSKWPCISTT